MDRYGAGITNSGINTANTAYFNLSTTSTATRGKILQITVGIAVAPTTAPAFYLTRTSARGTATSSLTGLPLDPAGPTALLQIEQCASGAQPTFTNTNKLAVGALAITAGGAWVWSFYDQPLVVPATSANGIAVCNTNASGATTGTFVCSALWDE